MQMGKRPMMWSPLVWDPNAPPAALVDAEAILNLWTGDIKTLAYNITLKVRFCFVPEFRLIFGQIGQIPAIPSPQKKTMSSQNRKRTKSHSQCTQPLEMTSSLLSKQNETVYLTS